MRFNKSQVGYDYQTLNRGFLDNNNNLKPNPDFVVCGKKFQSDPVTNNSSDVTNSRPYCSSFASKIYQLEDFEVSPIGRVTQHVATVAPPTTNSNNYNKKQIRINVSDYKNASVLNREVQAIRAASELEDFQRILNAHNNNSNNNKKTIRPGANNGLTKKGQQQRNNKSCFSDSEIQDIYDEYFGRYFHQLKQLIEVRKPVN